MHCTETQELRATPSIEAAQVTVEGVPLWCETATGTLRPMVPVSQRRAVFEAVLSLAHPGIRATRRMVCGVAAPVTWQNGAESARDVLEEKSLHRSTLSQQ